MKKLFLVLLAVLLAFSMAVVGCGGSSSDDDDDPDGPGGPGTPPPEPISMAGTWKVPVNFEYDENYKLDIQWGGENPTLPDGYQLVIESDEYISGLYRILKDTEITVSVKFKSDRPADHISFGFIDTTAAGGYWGQLTKGALIGKKPADLDDAKDFMEDEIATGFAADTEYEYEIDFTAIKAASSNATDANTFVIFLKADHKKAYTSGAGNVAAAKAEDFFTLTFETFLIEFGAAGTPPPPDPKITKGDLFKNGEVSDEIEEWEINGESNITIDDTVTNKIKLTWTGAGKDCDGEGGCSSGCTNTDHDAGGVFQIYFDAVDISDYKTLVITIEETVYYFGGMLLPAWEWQNLETSGFTHSYDLKKTDKFDPKGFTGISLNEIFSDITITSITAVK